MSRFVPMPDPAEVELLGPMKRCAACGEWWPADEEFFYRQEGRIKSPCKACQIESRQKLEGLPCIVDGCNQARKNVKDPRCAQHSREHYYTKRKEQKAKELAHVG